MHSHQHTVLAIEASTEQCSVALLSNKKVYSRSSDTPKSHAKVLLPMVDALIVDAGIDLDALSAIAVSIGPGSFTGIRIALSVAQGLGYGLGIPLIGENSLAILAKSMICRPDVSGIREYENAIIVTALDARMGEVYWSAHRVLNSSLVEISAPIVSHPDELNSFVSAEDTKILGCGHGWSLPNVSVGRLEVCQPKLFPHARSLIALVEESKTPLKFDKANGFNTLDPLYLRNEVTWDKRQRIRETKLV